MRSAVLEDDDSEKCKSIFVVFSLGTGLTSNGEFGLQRAMIVFGKSTVFRKCSAKLVFTNKVSVCLFKIIDVKSSVET